MKAVVEPLLTVEDYRATPEGPPWFQLVDGEFIMAPSPTLFHQRITGSLYRMLTRYLDKHPRGELFLAPLDVYLTPHDVFQPDLVYVVKERAHILAPDGIHGAPELVIEILSPSTADLDKTRKRKIYARVGVRELWLIDPTEREIQIYEPAKGAGKPARTVARDGVLETPLFPGLKISLVDVFKQ
jgi:Uma2 family endonuclease